MRPTLIEREDQLAALAAAYEAIRSGTGLLTFVGGEAGAGKTALVRRRLGMIWSGVVPL